MLLAVCKSTGSAILGLICIGLAMEAVAYIETHRVLKEINRC